MSEWIKCDRCNKLTKADSSGDKRYKIGIDGFNGYSTFHVCEWCLCSFYLDFLGWKWNDDECQYEPQERNCEPQERSDKCRKCEHYINPDYTRCKECGAERSDKE